MDNKYCFDNLQKEWHVSPSLSGMSNKYTTSGDDHLQSESVVFAFVAVDASWTLIFVMV